MSASHTIFALGSAALSLERVRGEMALCVCVLAVAVGERMKSDCSVKEEGES
jgi:hypothetical protein